MKNLIFVLIINLLFSQLSLELVATGFDKPVYVTTAPNDINKLFVIEQDGYVRTVNLLEENSENVFLDLTDRVHKPLFPADEKGLLGFAFDPNYENNGWIYINYNDKNDNTIVSRLKYEFFYPVDYVKDVGPKEQILREDTLMIFKQPYSNHNGGHIAFDSEDYLYISVGDGGSAGDPENRAQDTSNFFGSILRISPYLYCSPNYTIPDDNPFFSSDSTTKKEIWAYGLRNAWRFSFDRLTGDMYLGDVGQNSWEEINFIPSDHSGGINFGWNIMEASSCYNNIDCNKAESHLPIFEYPNDAKYIKTILGLKQKNVHGCSITGGYVYRGLKIPELYGKYFFGDYCTGKIWSFKYANGEIKDFEDHTDELLKSINKKSFYLSSFGESNDGELFLIDYEGSIYKLVK